MPCLNFLNFVKSRIENFPIVEQINGFDLSLLFVGERILTFQIGIKIFFTFAIELVVQSKLSTVEITPCDIAHDKLQNKEVFFITFPSSGSNISHNIHCNALLSSCNITVHFL